MNSNLYVAQNRPYELRAEAQRHRDAWAAQNQGERPNLLQLLKVLVLTRQPRLA